MSDDEFIEHIAREWIKYGGDSEGVVWEWRDLQAKVKELERGECDNGRD